MDAVKTKTKTAIAAELGVARSSLYYKPKKPTSDEELKNQINTVMEEHPAYGHRRVALALSMNHKKVRRVMRHYGMRPKLRRRFTPAKPDDVNRPETLIPNILKVFCPLRANMVWAGDFTYLLFCGMFWYVATVIDVHTREIIGWHIANHHTSALIIEALKDAVKRTGHTPEYFHSDQGSEYVSGVYGEVLMAHGIQASHSKKSSPWQNGFQESFYNNFKLELGNPERHAHIGTLIEAIHKQIAYYNQKRIHTILRMPPITYRLREEQKWTALAVTCPQPI